MVFPLFYCSDFFIICLNRVEGVGCDVCVSICGGGGGF